MPTEVKKLRNNRLLDIQTEISARVHASWIGREVDVLVEEIRDHSAHAANNAGPAADGPLSLALPLAHPDSRKIELRWDLKQGDLKQGDLKQGDLRQANRRESGASRPKRGLQAIGRTAGDLIVAIDLVCDVDAASALVGTVQRVETQKSSALLLLGQLSKTALTH